MLGNEFDGDGKHSGSTSGFSAINHPTAKMLLCVPEKSSVKSSCGESWGYGGECGGKFLSEATDILNLDGTLTVRVLSIRIEKKVNYFYEVTTSD